MQIPTKGTSKYLNVEDLPNPIIATIDRVTFEQSLRNPYVLHFVGDQLDPLPLNVTNRRILVGAMGNDDAHWHGRPVEVYVDRSVRNAQGQVTGGIRLRIPAGPAQPPALPSPSPSPAAAPVPGTATAPARTAPAAAPKPATQRQPAPVPNPGPLEQHRKALAGMDGARSREKLDAWATWRKGIGGTTPEQDDEAEDWYHRNLERFYAVPADVPF